MDEGPPGARRSMGVAGTHKKVAQSVATLVIRTGSVMVQLAIKAMIIGLAILVGGVASIVLGDTPLAVAEAPAPETLDIVAKRNTRILKERSAAGCTVKGVACSVYCAGVCFAACKLNPYSNECRSCNNNCMDEWCPNPC